MHLHLPKRTRLLRSELRSGTLKQLLLPCRHIALSLDREAKQTAQFELVDRPDQVLGDCEEAPCQRIDLRKRLRGLQLVPGCFLGSNESGLVRHIRLRVWI